MSVNPSSDRQCARRILLIVSMFPPDQHTGSLRWSRLISKLSARNFEFDVISADNKIFRIPATNKFPSGVHSVTRVRYPWNLVTTFVALAKSLPGSKGPTPTTLATPKFYERGVRSLKNVIQFMLALVVFPSFSMGWGRRTVRIGTKLVRARKIELIIASHPFAGCLLGAKLISRMTSTPWVADFRDPWANDPQSRFLHIPLLHKLHRRIEWRLLATAASVVAINRQLASLLCVKSDRVTIIPNSFDPAEAPLNSSVSDARRIVDIVFAGTLFENLQYRMLMDSLAQCLAEGVDLPLKIQYYGASSAFLLSSAQEAGVSLDYFEDHGLVSYQEVLKVMAEADLLLLFGWRGQGGECVVTGKIFDYLCSKTPIIAIGTEPGSAMADVLQETGGGKALSSIEDTVRFLKEVTAQPDAVLAALRSMRNENAIHRYSTTYTAGQFEMLIESILGESGYAHFKMIKNPASDI